MKTLKEIFNQNTYDVIIDTDTYNEIDDYFALAYAFGRTDKLKMQGVTIAPFFNERCETIADGIEKSKKEVLRLLELTGKDYPVKAGATAYLPDERTPVESDATRFILERAKGYSSDRRLYIVAIGAITNIASALLLDEGLADKIAVVWLGGNAFYEPKNDEFNLRQDVAGARVLLSSNAPLMQVPCMGVVSAFTTGKYELEHFLKGKNPLCDYLLQKTVGVAEEENKLPTWSRVIWDVVAVGALLGAEGEFAQISEKPRRLPTYTSDCAYGESASLPMLCVDRVERDRLFYDLFSVLATRM